MAVGQHQWIKRFRQQLNHLWLRSRTPQRSDRTVLLLKATNRWSIGSGVVAILAVATAGQAQQVVPLPPPPTVSVPSLAPSSFNNPNPVPGGETVFLAPLDRQGTARDRYTVYVSGDSPYLLQQVRAIEPNASIQQYQGLSVIQAGTFDSESRARQQLAALNAQGIMAEITTTNTATNLAPSNPGSLNLGTASRFLVVVPGSRDQLPALADRAIRMGIRQEAIQQKDAPLGPHLEIGPFADHSDASKISQFLNGGGLDARVYYDR